MADLVGFLPPPGVLSTVAELVEMTVPASHEDPAVLARHDTAGVELVSGQAEQGLRHQLELLPGQADPQQDDLREEIIEGANDSLLQNAYASLPAAGQ